MLPAILSIAAVTVALVVVLHKQDAIHAATIRALLDQADKDRADHRTQIAELLQRIQAPEVAVMQHATETAGPGDAVYPLDENEQATAQDHHLAAQQALEMIHADEATDPLYTGAYAPMP